MYLYTWYPSAADTLFQATVSALEPDAFTEEIFGVCAAVWTVTILLYGP